MQRLYRNSDMKMTAIGHACLSQDARHTGMHLRAVRLNIAPKTKPGSVAPLHELRLGGALLGLTPGERWSSPYRLSYS